MQIVIIRSFLRLWYITIVKRSIVLSVLIYSTLFGWLGQEIDKGNWIGGWSIILGTLGAIFGLWVGYKIHKLYF